MHLIQQPAPVWQKYLNLQWASTAMLLQVRPGHEIHQHTHARCLCDA